MTIAKRGKKTFALRSAEEIKPLKALPSLSPIEYVGEIEIHDVVDFEEKATRVWSQARESLLRFGLLLRAGLKKLGHGEVTAALDRIAERVGESPRVLRSIMAVASAAGGPLLPGDADAWLKVPAKAEAALALARRVEHDDQRRQELVTAGVLTPTATVAAIRDARRQLDLDLKAAKPIDRDWLENRRSQLMDVIRKAQEELAQVEAQLARAGRRGH